jgi:hypothetical protein
MGGEFVNVSGGLFVHAVAVKMFDHHGVAKRFL